MSERCLNNSTIATGKPISELKQLFPNAKKSKTTWNFSSENSTGVYILDAGSMRMVKVVGPCPNFKDGNCILAERCLTNSLQK